MRSRTIFAIGATGLLAVAVVVYFARPRIPPRTLARLQAEFSRPEVISGRPGVVELRLDGANVLTTIPEFPCDRKFQLDVVVPSRNPQESLGLIIALRRPEDGSRAFATRDFSCDLLVALNDRWISPTQQKTLMEPQQFHVVPGRYRVRYYLQSRIWDAETDPLPTTELLGESSIVLLPPTGDGRNNVRIPLSDPRHAVSPESVPPL